MKIPYFLNPFKYLALLAFAVVFSCIEAPDRKTMEVLENENQSDVQPPKEITENEFWVKVENMNCYVMMLQPDGPLNWSGDCDDFKISGKGTLKTKDTFKLVGEAKNGIMSGYGELEVGTEKNKYTYKGEFRGWINGLGYKKYNNGDSLVGRFVNNNTQYGVLHKFFGDAVYFLNQESVPKSKYDLYMAERNKEIKYAPVNTRTTLYYKHNDFDVLVNRQDADFYRTFTLVDSSRLKENLVQDFYVNGKLKSTFHVSHLDYRDNYLVEEGDRKNYSEDGSLVYEWDKLLGHVISYRDYVNNSSGTLSGNGDRSYVWTHPDGTGNRQVWKKGNDFRTLEFFDSDGNTTSRGDFALSSDNTLYPISYEDNYTDDGSIERVHHINFEYLNWPEDDESSKHYDIVGLGVTIDNLTTNNDLNLHRVIPFDINLDNNFIINYRAKESYENRIILTWGQELDRATDFLFNDGLYRMERKFEGVIVDKTEWKRSSSLKRRGFNDYKIFKFSDKLLLTINGEKVQTFDNFSVDSKYIGFKSWGDKTTIEHFNIKEFIKNQDRPSDPESEDIGDGDETWKGSGSGFILTSDGYIVTNHHVIDKARSIEVTITNEDGINDYSAELIKSDESIDLAILKINDPKFSSDIEITNGIRSSGVRVGEEVFALGYPLTFIMGEEVKFTDGRISSLTGFQGDIKSFQTSIPIQPGNSGGPMMDYNGNFIGIMTSVLNKEVAENVSYSVKANNLMSLIEVLPFDIELPGKVNSRDDVPNLVERLAKQTVFIKIK